MDRVRRSHEVVKRMLRARGYTFDDEDCEIDDEASGPVCELEYESPKGPGIVYWPASLNMGVQEISYFTKLTVEGQYKSFILVAEDATSQAKKSIINDMYHVYGVEFFKLSALQMDITQHRYVPTYTRLSEEDKERIQKQYHTPLDKFPLLIHTQPISRYFDFRPGDLIKVENYYNIHTHLKDLPVPNVMYRYVV